MYGYSRDRVHNSTDHSESVWTYKMHVIVRISSDSVGFGVEWNPFITGGNGCEREGLRVMRCVGTQRDTDDGEKITRSSFEFGQNEAHTQIGIQSLLLTLCLPLSRSFHFMWNMPA